jgi:hypothetical protein
MRIANSNSNAKLLLALEDALEEALPPRATGDSRLAGPATARPALVFRRNWYRFFANLVLKLEYSFAVR